MSTDTTGATAPDQQGHPELKRVLGPGLLLLFIVGDILGAGVYAVTGRLAGQVGGIAWLPFLVAFAIATLTAYSYLELVTKYPQAAGAALYAHKAFGVHFVTFLVAFTVVCSGITSASTSSGLLASNLLIGLGNDAPSKGLVLAVALGFMLVLALINLRGVGESVKFNVVLTVIEMAALAIVIGIGIWVIGKGDGDLGRITVFESPDDKGLFMAVTIATAIAFFSMVGFEDSVNMVEETKDPERIFPRMMLTGLGIAVIIYMLVAISVVAVIPADKIGAPSNAEAGILIDVVKIGAPDLPIDDFFPFMTVFAVANTALINMLMASRLIYGMARQHVLPPVLGKVLPGRRSPYVAIGFTTLLAFGLITYVRLGSESTIVGSLSGTTALLLLAVFTIVNIACLILRRDPARPNGFRAPTIVPVLGAIFCAYLLGPWARLEADMIQYKIAAGLLGIGIVLWAATRLFYKPEGGHFADIEHMDVDPSDDPR
ncbi:amino acid permease [Pimelobacter simplex]|uniref:Amino acid permease-associated region n=1 Tax=Nocardioides simplex TaxID=2045 RepID=A0A0C5XLN6_NOCSI|nr:APC family permease [Pimelobacter simplex]AJR18352.1 Amino acid permease-associated region [Pimelobacter simplex]MCG8151643.1 amino acid permease [Pimelobacter simplex]GEB13177.1 amino acid permease [Pimelobacter simplex]SFM48449.1 amino acid/polyamine/organocation transporter, APC superfamily [Pimelobacter simplex]